MKLGITHQVHALVSITKRDEKWFLSNGFNRPSITLPMGYSIQNLSKSTKNRNNEPCFIGSLDWKPNQEGLIWFIDNVWPLVQKEHPNLTFHVAGRNTPIAIIEKLKENKSIKFRWLKEGANPKNFFSFKLYSHDLTRELTLQVIEQLDANEDVDDAISLWNSQIGDLKRILGV